MTFSSPHVRELFHKLPVATQAAWDDMERVLNASLQQIEVISVILCDEASEVIVRIHGELNDDS